MISIGDIEEKIKPAVLVVEDEADMRQNLRELLANDFEVFTAANATEAIRIFYNEQFRLNVVLLDIRLPDMSGIEVIKKIKNINLNPDIIMVTALNTVETAVEALRYGAYDYVTKPFFAADLIATVRRALEKKDYSRKLKELTDRLDQERIAAEHRQVLFHELQMRGRFEGHDLSAEEKTLFHFPVLSEEDYDFTKLKEKLESDLKTKIEIGVGARILVVGSNVKLSESLKDILAEQYQMYAVFSAREAFEILAKENYDLALLDFNVPDMDGTEVLLKMKKEHPNVDVIMIAAKKDFDAALKAMKLGAYDYIALPFIPEDLRASVMRVLEKRSAKEVLEKLVQKYRETHLSFELRLKLLIELFRKRKNEKKTINTDDFYAFFPELKEKSHGMDIRVSLPLFANEEKLEKYVREKKAGLSEQ